METKSARFERFGRDNFPAGDWRHAARMVKGDVNLCLLHTAMGKVVSLDTNVYDLATYSSIVELSERSVLAGQETLDYPDYTRGGWRTAKPSPVEPMDPKTFGTIVGVEDKDALKVKGS